MRYLVLILLTLSVSCGEELSKPVERKEEESQDSDMGLDESLVGGSDGGRDAGCCIRVGSEVFEQIEVTYDRPELGLYRDTFVKPISSYIESRDFGLGLD